MVFISYSWDSENHIERVSQLVRFLRKSGVEVTWDRDLKLGKRIPSYMEEELQRCNQVLFICTPRYKQKADGRTDGVGYETNIITGDVYANHNDMKYIPVLFEGSWTDSLPVWASGKLGADLRQETLKEFEKLLDALQDSEEMVVENEPKLCENSPEFQTDQPEELDEPASAEEKRALREIYQELLSIKSWLVQLERTASGMEDPNKLEMEMWEKVKRLRVVTVTYDFILTNTVLDSLSAFFRLWNEFQYLYTHLEEEMAKDAAKLRGRLARLLHTTPDCELINRHYHTKDACNDTLAVIAKRMS